MPISFTPPDQQHVDFMQNQLLAYVNEGTHSATEQALVQSTIQALQGNWPLTTTRQQDEFLQYVLVSHVDDPNNSPTTAQLLADCIALLAG